MSALVVAGDVSGTCTLQAPSAAGSTVLTLPTGTDTLVGKATTDTLTNKSIAATQLTGTIAASALPAGSVLQVVTGTYATSTTNSTTTYADTGLTATITPTRNTSKILVLICHAECQKNGTTNSLRSQLLRGATVLASLSEDGGYSFGSTTTYFGISGLYYDSPATTSATTYKTQFKCTSTTSVTVQQSSIPSTITLMEIAG